MHRIHWSSLIFVCALTSACGARYGRAADVAPQAANPDPATDVGLCALASTPFDENARDDQRTLLCLGDQPRDDASTR